MSDKKSLYADDFFTGLICGLAKLTQWNFDTRADKFHPIMERLMVDVVLQAEQHNLSIKFRIRCNSIHGVSGTVDEMIYQAMLKKLGVLDDGKIFHIDSGYDYDRLLKDLPGSPEMYIELARRFIELSA